MAIPYSPEANDLKAAFEKAFQMAISNLPNKIRNSYASEGYDVNVDVDASGKPTIGSFGASGVNPYGTYQQSRRLAGISQGMKREYDVAKGIRGGLANQGMADIRMRTGMGDYSMLGRLESGKLGALSDYQNSINTYRQSLAQLDLDQSRQNIQSGNFTPAGNAQATDSGDDGTGGTNAGIIAASEYSKIQSPLQKTLALNKNPQAAANAYKILQQTMGGQGRTPMVSPVQRALMRPAVKNIASGLNNTMRRG